MAAPRNVSGDLHDLAKEVSTQSVEGVLWFFFLLLVNARLERVTKGMIVKKKPGPAGLKILSLWKSKRC